MVIPKLDGSATGQVSHQSPIPVPQDPVADPQPLAHEDLGHLQKELGEVKEAKTRLETENLVQKLELERSWKCQKPQKKPWNGTRKCSKASELFLNDLVSFFAHN
ncbi:hypothetical protein B9Z55_022894 [Caenorhabditis nigoni]|uniref:Uncharacterized protein n=1 Tax=Caenorhabditis nigoni TaxID=1611254 RepID=A0A2G5SMZ0_9PELO|nr:hypothetical protein B9Z55_022894 [Caenorhabditis nigoni]